MQSMRCCLKRSGAYGLGVFISIPAVIVPGSGIPSLLHTQVKLPSIPATLTLLHAPTQLNAIEPAT